MRGVIIDNIKKGSELELTIESLAYGGNGIAHVDGLAVFIERVLPGQKVLAHIYKKKKSYAEAYPIKILEKATNEVEPRCEYFGICGGCRIQNLDYQDQLGIKTRQVQDLIERVGHFKDVSVPLALPSPSVFHYRNKMEFTFTPNPWRVSLEDEELTFGLGMHVPGRFDKVVNLDYCLLQKPILNDILKFTADWALEHQWTLYNLKTHEGWARNLMLRYGVHTHEIMVNLVTRTDDKTMTLPYKEALLNQFPQISTIVNNVTTRQAGVSTGEFEVLLHGNGLIRDKLDSFEFEISANAFFQTNTLQAETLYEETLKVADLQGDEIVYDLYCGTGTITLFLAAHAKTVYGIEVVKDAVVNARANARQQNVKNVHFLQGDLKDIFNLDDSARAIPPADVIVVDPPRAGLHPNLVKEMLLRRPKKIIYVSCNPATLARDLELFCRESYALTSLQPVDMFPHTNHIETVVGLVHKTIS